MDSFNSAEIMQLKKHILTCTRLNTRQVFIDQEESRRFELDYIDITFIDTARVRTAFYKYLVSQGIFATLFPPFKYSKTTPTKDRKYLIRIEGHEAIKWFKTLKG